MWNISVALIFMLFVCNAMFVAVQNLQLLEVAGHARGCRQV